MLQVILLIYEYAIAVESSLVQRNSNRHRVTNTFNHNKSYDQPFADKLGRSYFGFDQESFERMPLLVNALQENSYIDHAVDFPITTAPYRKMKFLNLHNNYTNSYNNKPIRRTSPRPFIFEYRSPTPSPFINTRNYNSRTWIDNYRNTQRLQNFEKVIKYLEKTINAKFGDLYNLPPSTNIAFSGVYIQPNGEDKNNTPTTTSTSELIPQATNTIYNYIDKPKLQSDPLFTFKPDNPGDVNLLADQALRFSLKSAPNTLYSSKHFKIPMFHPIFKTGCIGIRCRNMQNNVDKKIIQALQGSKENSDTVLERPKAFSVMLNLYPFKQSKDVLSNTQSLLDKIYITTSKPKLQFRQKIARPRSYLTRYKRPRFLSETKLSELVNSGITKAEQSENEKSTSIPAKVELHVNLYPNNQISEMTTPTDVETSNTDIYKNNIIIPTSRPQISSTNSPINYYSSNPSINYGTRLKPLPNLQSIPTMIPFFETTMSVGSTSTWSQNTPEILKFSHEDAKVPVQYKNLDFKNTFVQSEYTGHDFNIKRASTESIIDEDVIPNNDKMKELLMKLKNKFETTTNKEEITVEITPRISTVVYNTEVPTSTTIRTYVPQINGHYRSINQNSRNNNNLINQNTEAPKTTTVAEFRRPPYVEIRRKNIKTSIETE